MGGLSTKIHMAVRGLGCPVRFTLTAGQKGDAPQATDLIEGLPAQVVIADTAYDSDALRQAIADKQALAVIPNNPSRTFKHPLDKHLYAQRHLIECYFSKLKQFRRVASGASRPASRKPQGTTPQSSHSPLSSYGYGKCPHDLVHEMRISLVFPFLVFLTLARWKTTLVAFVVLGVGTTKIIGLYGSNEAVRSLGMTLEFVFLFVAGIVIATRIRGLRHRLAALSTPAATCIWAVALLVVSFSPESTETIDKLSNGGLLVISGGAAALIVILSTVEGRALSLLLGPVPSYLGRISYSLYLIHVIVLAAVVHTFAGYAPVPVLVGLGAIASIPLADLSQRFIEVPTTNFGRRLARRLAA